MTALVVLGILGVTALFLAGALTYLYRWRVRKKLFPQLPRLWKGDRNRFLASTGLFVVSLLAFMVVSLITGPSLPEPPQQVAAKKAQGPSFDGAPPPPMPPPEKPQTPPVPAPETAAASYSTPDPAVKNEVRTAAQSKEAAPASAPQQQAAVQTLAPIAPAAPQTPNDQKSQQPAASKPSQAATAAPPKAEPKAPVTAGTEPVKSPAPEPAAQAAAQTPVPGSAPSGKQTRPAKAEPPKANAVTPAVPPVKTKKVAKAATSSKAKAPAPAKAASKAYTVCVASFKDQESAQRQIGRLAKKGLKGRIVKAQLKGKGVWYRVCLGEFASPGKAAAKSKAWRDNDLVKTPFVVRLR
jgi:hypothetical protein